MKAMKKLLYSILLVSLLSACGKTDKAGAEDELKSEISALESQLLKSGDATKDKEAAVQLVKKTEAFAKANPDNEETPEMLFKAADVANGSKNYGKAVQLWGAVWRKHPDHPRAPMALFLQGFTFDSKLGKSNMARKYYMEFLKQYPNDSLATQVKQLLLVVRDSPEDLVKKFQEAEEN